MREMVQTNRVIFKKSQLVYLKIKRLLDILCSLLGLILLIPVFLVVAVMIKIEDPKGSIIYKQERIGRSGRVFMLYKFRSMRMNAPELSTNEFHDAQTYVTKVGKFIRNTSIDELPQLWNVLIGNMSLVGPRPLLVRERDVHIKRFLNGIYQVRPGITGMAQTHGRDDMDNDQKVEWDRKYVENISFLVDFKLILRTIAKVIQREGIRSNVEVPLKDEENQNSHSTVS